MTAPDPCPHCGADLTGEPIPEPDLKYFPGRTHFPRVGITVHPDSGEFIAYRCPDCNGTWEREDE